ncbi:MAG: phosphoenolpyruvate synthase [Synergistaceae bacterium]|jgi:pyruvate,water dikinase|nr:phosphoenolpyruvate synthase [Synergistaceae bacterium]
MKYILNLSDKAAQCITLSGGKGANLAKLLDFGFNVPDGYVITTDAYGENLPPKIWDELSSLDLGGKWAVRSSATAEDLPDNSFAGQQDTYLNVTGFGNIERAVVDCFASVNNERAVSYRKKNGVTEFSMAVVLQKMVNADFAGVIFTADPQTSDRLTTVIEAVSGLGGELVSGREIPTAYKVKNGNISVAGKQILADRQVLELSNLGKRIEEKFGLPQDIEWCLENGKIFIVQSRAITTLYPKPHSKDGFKRCFISIGHAQMMTDPILPLGGEFIAYFAGIKNAAFTGGRMYIEITHDLRDFFHRNLLLWCYKNADLPTYNCIREILARKDYIRSIPKGEVGFHKPKKSFKGIIKGYLLYRRGNLRDISAYFERMEKSVSDLEAEISRYRGEELVRFIKYHQREKLKDIIYDPIALGFILFAIIAANYINKMGLKLLGKKDFVNETGKSLPNNVTAQMGLELGRLADKLRDNADLIEYMKNGGVDAKIIGAEYEAFIKKYGFRGNGEIDITRPRYAEEPGKVVAMLLGCMNQPKGYADELFAKGLSESGKAADELLSEAPGNKKLKYSVWFYRNYWGLREAPKYYWIKHYWIYKNALLAEAKRLDIRNSDDIYYLNFDELENAFGGGKIDYVKIDAMREDYKRYWTLTPPRVIFSDGEVPETRASTSAPDGAMTGLGVSGGIIEGKACVIMDVADVGQIEDGDILVTKFTDPSWTPVFLTIKGLVAEVGGMVTHGSVIAREYGLPAVVSVENAARHIKTGDIIRVNGDEGYVEILKSQAQIKAVLP